MWFFLVSEAFVSLILFLFIVCRPAKEQNNHSIKLNKGVREGMKTNVRIGLCTLCLAIPVVLNYHLLWRHIYLELNIVAIVSFLFSGFFILGCCTAIIMFHITSEDGLLDQILHLRGRIKTRKKLWPEQNNHSIKLKIVL